MKKIFTLCFFLEVLITSCNAQTQEEERIIFDSEMGNNNRFELYSISPDGTDIIQHTNDAVSRRANTNAQFSPNGKYVMFGTYKYGGYKIAIANSDFTNQRKFSLGSNYSYTGTWSPDSKKVAYNKVHTDSPPYFEGDFEIFVMNADGSNDTNISNTKGADGNPVWSADGKRILFSSNRDGNSEIYIMDTDGQNVKRITNTKDYDEFGASWSADSKKIAFHRIKRSGTKRYIDLIVLDTGSGDEINLTNNEPAKRNLFVPYYDDAEPIFYKTSWSKKSNRIVFSSKRNSKNFEIYTINADGTNLKQITKNGFNNVFPNWYTN